MENFIAYNPTSLHFGKNVLNNLGTTVALFGKKVLLVYGKGSIKKSGLYEKVMFQLNEVGAKVFEYSGIKSNPIIDDVNAAAEIGRKNNVDVVLAVGGGSVIDSAKIISIALHVKNDAWDFFEYKIKPEKASPLIAVLTLAATGTEMNPYAVVQNPKTGQKPGYGGPLMYPKHSFLDPQNTFSVPKDYTAFGIVDLIAHSLEAYFGKGDATLSDKFVFATIKEALEFGPLLMEDLNNYDLRAKIMYAATAALNGLNSYGRVSGDWGVHGIGHSLSVLYDTPHGASLSIAYPAWLKLQKDRIPERIEKLGFELFNSESVDDTIYKLEYFFKLIGSPTRLSDIGINIETEKELIYENMKINKVNGANQKLTGPDFLTLIDLMDAE
ncbi:MAG: iron-containing alcohol dehydrogenase [Bacteroidetes bacterium]|nr:iron-containing alcohol dehydrogenase [Bacteroidota bacterium]